MEELESIYLLNESNILDNAYFAKFDDDDDYDNDDYDDDYDDYDDDDYDD